MNGAEQASSTTAPGVHRLAAGITSRRGLLSGGTAALLAGAAAATAARGATPTGDDAALLELCAQFHRLHAAIPMTPDDAAESLLDQRWQVSDLIRLVPASTEAGRRGKASVAFVLLRENHGNQPSSDDAAFALAALRDIAGPALPGDSIDQQQNPDDELIALCERLTVVVTEINTMLDADTEAPDGGGNSLRYEALVTEHRGLYDRLYEFTEPPATVAGMLALARAAYAEWPRNLDGSLDCHPGMAEWLAAGVIEFHAGRASA